MERIHSNIRRTEHFHIAENVVTISYRIQDYLLRYTIDQQNVILTKRLLSGVFFEAIRSKFSFQPYFCYFRRILPSFQKSPIDLFMLIYVFLEAQQNFLE